MKALEEKGIGRPSTFASIIDVILNRGYVTKRGQALIPSWLAFSVVRLLEEHFADLVDYDFTAALEDDLDAIARGEQSRAAWLKEFYFGSEGHVGLRNIVDNLGEIDARELNSDADRRRCRAPPRPVRPVPRGRRPREPDAKPRIVNIPEDLRAGRADRRTGARAHRGARRRRPRAGREPRQRQTRRRQGRPLRTLRAGGRSRRGGGRRPGPPASSRRPRAPAKKKRGQEGCRA